MTGIPQGVKEQQDKYFPQICSIANKNSEILSSFVLATLEQDRNEGFDGIYTSKAGKIAVRIRKYLDLQRFGDITIQEVHELWIKQDKKCALTRLPIDWIRRDNGVTCSIDRISSDGEYTIDNIQLVHKDINLMKNHFNQDYFIQMCKLVCENNKQ